MGVHSCFSIVCGDLRSTLGAIGHCRDEVTGVSPTSASDVAVPAAGWVLGVFLAWLAVSGFYANPIQLVIPPGQRVDS
jgi:hypothetical protein